MVTEYSRTQGRNSKIYSARLFFLTIHDKLSYFFFFGLCLFSILSHIGKLVLSSCFNRMCPVVCSTSVTVKHNKVKYIVVPMKRFQSFHMVDVVQFSYNASNNILYKQPFYRESSVYCTQCNTTTHIIFEWMGEIKELLAGIHIYSEWGVSRTHTNTNTHATFSSISPIIPAHDSHLEVYRFDVICNHIIYNKFEVIHLIIILLQSSYNYSIYSKRICQMYSHWINYTDKTTFYFCDFFPLLWLFV